jgi:hypothetical protein
MPTKQYPIVNIMSTLKSKIREPNTGNKFYELQSSGTKQRDLKYNKNGGQCKLMPRYQLQVETLQLDKSYGCVLYVK